MKVLLLGGTGTIGRYLVDILSVGDYEIYITSRNSYESELSHIHYEQGNAHNLDFVQSIFDKYGYFDAIVDFMIYSPNEFREHCELFLLNTKQYVFLSSARVYADSQYPLTEKSPRLLEVIEDDSFKNSEKYAIAKAKEEDILKEYTSNNWTIIRPYITYGVNRFQLGVYEKEDWLYRAMNGKSIVVSKDIISKKTTMTYAGDVSRGIAGVVGNDNTLGQIYNITANNAVLWKDVLNIYLDTLEKKGMHVKVEYVEKASDVINRSEQVRYDRLYDREFDNSKIKSIIGDTRFVDLQKGLSECLEEFLGAQSYKDINWVTQARMDKCVSEKTSLHSIGSIRDKLIYMVLRYFVDYSIIRRVLK